MQSEPGLLPTIYLRLIVSQRAAKPGELLSIRVEGTDAAALVGGKVVRVDQEVDGEWTYVGTQYVSSSRDAAGMFRGRGTGPSVVRMTMEAYRGNAPMYFLAPDLPPGDYRMRRDLILGDGGVLTVNERTATLYTMLLILDPASASADD